MNSRVRKLITVWHCGLAFYLVIGSLWLMPLCPRANGDDRLGTAVNGVESVKPVGTPAQQQWLASNLSQRQDLAEQVGIKGAASYAAEQGYVPVLSVTEKITLHGPDGVYRARDGKLVVIEAKGGTSSINQGYGFSQGTAEHAVAGAERMLKQDAIPLKERIAYETVIKEASRGNLRVEIVRTTHVLGEPNLPKLEKVNLCTTQATEIAKAASKELSAAEAAIGGALNTGKNVVVKIGGGVGVIGGGFQVFAGVQEIREGKPVEGLFDAAGGLGTVTACSLVISGKVATGTTVGAVVAVVDAGKDIVEGIRDGDTKRTVVGTVKFAAISATSAGFYTGQPVFVVIGGVTYAGVIIYEQKDAIVHGAKVAGGWAKPGFDATWNASVYAVHKTGEGIVIAKDATWNGGVYVVHKTGEGLSVAKDATWNAGVYAVHKTGEDLSTAKDATWSAGVYAVHKTGEGLSIAKDATWNAGAYAAQKTGEGFTTAKDATWNGGVAAIHKIGSWRDAAWNSCFKK